MKMWKLSFEDKDEFISFYFDKVYRDDNTLVLLSDDNFSVVAALQILPYQIKIGNKIHDAGYISGAMTHPGYRKKGYMQQLLLAAFEEMKKKNYTFTFLIPQKECLFDFYAKYGYEKAFAMTIETVNLTNDNIESSDVEVYSNFENLPLEEIYHSYCGFLSQKKNVVLKTKEQFRLVVEDLFIDKGRIFYLKKNGIVFAVNEEKVFIKEIFYAANNFKQLLLSATGKNFQSYEAIIRNIQPDENSHLYGMIKILDNSCTIATENIYMNMMLNE